jgi:hypothetical protein
MATRGRCTVGWEKCGIFGLPVVGHLQESALALLAAVPVLIHEPEPAANIPITSPRRSEPNYSPFSTYDNLLNASSKRLT